MKIIQLDWTKQKKRTLTNNLYKNLIPTKNYSKVIFLGCTINETHYPGIMIKYIDFLRYGFVKYDPDTNKTIPIKHDLL